MTSFGSFQTFCTDVPSYPWCNLYFAQLAKADSTLLVNVTTAGVGVRPTCSIPHIGDGHLGNIANMIACFVSMLAMGALIFAANRRKAAVGRVELNMLFGMYLFSLPLQLLTTGSVLTQNSIPIIVLTAIHAGVIAAVFWMLLGNAIVATQVVEDGTPAAIVPLSTISFLFFAATTYVSLDTAFGLTTVFQSHPPEEIRGVAMFILTSIFPAATVLVYFAVMAYVVVHTLKEVKPLVWYGLSFVLFILSQLAFFLLSGVLCRASNAIVDASFIATILETCSLVVLFFAWRSITEDSWDEGWYTAKP
jgi:hypothetical protein